MSLKFKDLGRPVLFVFLARIPLPYSKPFSPNNLYALIYSFIDDRPIPYSIAVLSIVLILLIFIIFNFSSFDNHLAIKKMNTFLKVFLTQRLQFCVYFILDFHMYGLFADAKKFNQDISGWDVSNVITMHSMFAGAITFDQNLSQWNVSKVIIHDNFAINSRIINSIDKLPNFNF